MPTTKVDSLHDLLQQIRQGHKQVLAAVRSGIDHARRVGELLLGAKDQIGRGEWVHWVRTNCPFSERTATGYMLIAKRWEDIKANRQRIADLTISQALRGLRKPGRKKAHRPRPRPVSGGIIQAQEVLEAKMVEHHIQATLEDVMAFLESIGVTEDQLLAIGSLLDA